MKAPLQGRSLLVRCAVPAVLKAVFLLHLHPDKSIRVVAALLAVLQAVVLLVQHSPAGSVGLILNRPSSLKLGIGKGGLKFGIIGAPSGMQETFAANRVYCGGMVRQDVSASVRPGRREAVKVGVECSTAAWCGKM
jgi:hypothetical protein